LLVFREKKRRRSPLFTA